MAERCSARLREQAQIAPRFDGAASHLYRKLPRYNSTKDTDLVLPSLKGKVADAA